MADNKVSLVGTVTATGRQGPAGTIAVGDVSTGEPGSGVSITNAGTPESAVLSFTIPRGVPGASMWSTSNTITGEDTVTVADVAGRSPQIGDLVISASPDTTGAVGRIVAVAPDITVSYQFSVHGGHLANVKNFGAVADGVTDDSGAIQEALDSGFGVVFFPPGVYGLRRYLECPANVTLLGYGATLRKNDPGSGVETTCGILANWDSSMRPAGETTLPAGYDGLSNITILGLTFDGNGAAPGRTGSNIVTFDHARNIIVRDCTFYRVKGSHALEFNAIDGGIADNCRFFGHVVVDPDIADAAEFVQIDSANGGGVDSGMTDGTPSRNITVNNCLFSGDESGNPPATGVGSHSVPGLADNPWYDNIAITNCTIVGSTAYGVHPYAWRRSHVTDCTIISDDGNNGVRVDGSQDVVVANCIAELGAYGTPIAIYTASTGTVVAGNRVEGGKQGIHPAGSTHTVVTGNYIKNPNTYGISIDNGSDVLISGNVIDGAGYPDGGLGAIRVSNSIGESSGVSITGNRVLLHGGGTEVSSGVSNTAGDTWVFANDFAGLPVATSGTAVVTTPNRI